MKAKYPEVADVANYVLYAFFDYDLEKLDAWQKEYDQIFGDIQPRIAMEGCYVGVQQSKGGSACSQQ